MKMDDIRKYIDLRDSLVREKQELEERLRQINEALGQQESPPQSSSPAPAAKPSSTPRPGAGGRRGRPSRSGVSLRDAVLQVTSSGPKTKQEILDGVASLGYRFSTKNPLNSLGVILYGKNPKFKNDNGRFSPVGGGSSASSGASSSAGAFGRKKRQMSPEARERIAAAQRARWAKAKNQ
jgi:hypothetical protein